MTTRRRSGRAARLLPPCAGVALLFAVRLAAGQQTTPPLDIYFAATPQPVVTAMLRLAQVSADDVVYDLGSGDGRIVILAAQRFGARGVGIELQPALNTIARQTAREAGVADRVRFVDGDLFAADISDATVVMLWLSPSGNARLEPKLRRELRPGARVVSHQFPIGAWPPDRTVHADDGTELYLWTIASRAGRP